MIELFEKYPILREKLDYTSLGKFPTPVDKLYDFGSAIGLDNLYIKRDDLTSQLYGGNKVRKLEFILGYAKKEKVKRVITFGCAGSNHALATAIFSNSCGIRSVSLLLSQPNAQYVRNNLLASYFYGAKLYHCPNKTAIAFKCLSMLIGHGLKHGHFPIFIPPGGSSPLGTVGFVNAALELKNQIGSGVMPEPDYIYVALGTMGTAVGLLLGVLAAKLKSKIVAVRVVDKNMANIERVENLFNKTNLLLNSLDPSFTLYNFPKERIIIKEDFFGEKYALFTPEAMKAVSLIKNKESIKLEGTYTGKTLAALINDANSNNLNRKVVLLWNTYNSADLSDIISNVDYRKLPLSFHMYFNNEVQPLDK